MATWRDRYQPIIRRILRDTADLPEPERTREINRRRRDDYPCQRHGWAYQVWLDEFRRQRGLAGPGRRRSEVLARAGQLSLDLPAEGGA